MPLYKQIRSTCLEVVQTRTITSRSVVTADRGIYVHIKWLVVHLGQSFRYISSFLTLFDKFVYKGKSKPLMFLGPDNAVKVNAVLWMSIRSTTTNSNKKSDSSAKFCRIKFWSF